MSDTMIPRATVALILRIARILRTATDEVDAERLTCAAVALDPYHVTADVVEVVRLKLWPAELARRAEDPS